MRKHIPSILISLQLLAFYAFSFTKGLAYEENYNTITYCNELLTSGGEDDIFVYFTSPLYLILLSISFFISKKALFYCLVSVFTIQLLFSFGEVCSVPETILTTYNFPLILLVAIPMINIAVTNKLYTLDAKKP